MSGGAARAFVTLLAIALFVAFIKGGPAEMWAWLARTLTGDPRHASTIGRGGKGNSSRRSPDIRPRPFQGPPAPGGGGGGGGAW